MATAAALTSALLLASGCSRDTIVRRRDGSYFAGRPVNGANDHMELIDGDRTYRVAKQDVEDIDHPGAALFLAGALLTSLGALSALDGDAGPIGWGGMLAVTGLGLSLSSRAALSGEAWAQEPGVARLPRDRAPGWVVGGLFLPQHRANGPMVGYEFRRPNGMWSVRPYAAALAVTGARDGVRATDMAVAAGVGGGIGQRYRLTADVAVNNARQIVFPLFGDIGATRRAWQITAGLGAEFVSRPGWFLRATIGITYRFDMAPLEEGDDVAFTITPCGLGVRL